MNYLALAIGCCLLAQAEDDSDRYKPDLIRAPHNAAPAATLEDPPAEEPQPPDTAELDAQEHAPAAHEHEHEPEHEHQREQPPEEEAPPPRSVRPHADALEPTGHMQPVDANTQQRLRPPELIAQALETPKQGALVGTPLTLSKAIARAPDRASQLKIAQAYWRLTTAQADYHWAREQGELLREYTKSHTNTAGVLSARATSRADVRDAQLAVQQLQQELADLAPLADQSLPLASDRPHVGEYRTDYERIFGNRQPPGRIRLIHRTLPVRRRAIDAHADAIVAGLDAVETAGDEFRRDGRGLSTLMGALALLKQERHAFIAEVRNYNVDIAEYAFTVAPPNARPEALVSMLIRSSQPAGGPRSGDANSGAPTRQTFRKEPLTPGPFDPDEDGDERTTNYAPRGHHDDPGVYQGLMDIKSEPLRVQKLAHLLHWDRNLAAEVGRSLSLADCLNNVSPDRRWAVIEAYWTARESAGRFQAATELQEQLAALQSVAIALRGEAGAAEASVRLQAARRAAKASLLDAEVALNQAQFVLGQAMGHNDNVWLLPTTPPQAGRYVVSMRARRGHSRTAFSAELMTLEFDKLQHRADALIQCDALRADLIVHARANDSGGDETLSDELTPLDRVVWATNHQNEETLTFLRDLTRYNMAIARYALSTLPANVSGKDLAGKLAISRTTLRD